MSRTSTLILLGILTILTPFSGLPISVRTLFTVIFGACVASIGISLRARDVKTAHLPFESAPPSEPESPQGVSPI